MNAPRIIRRTLPFQSLWLAAFKSRLAFFGEMRWQELSFGWLHVIDIADFDVGFPV